MIIVILEVNKHLFKYCILLEIDFQTHVFGYPNTCVWISNHACLDLFFTGYQELLRPYLTSFRKHVRILVQYFLRLEDKFLISVRPCNILYFILEVFVLFEILKSYWPKRGICELTL